MDTMDITFISRVLIDCGFSESAVRSTLTAEFPHDDVDAAIDDAQALSRRLDAEIALALA